LPSIPIADSFLAGSILSLLMPVLLLIGLVTWYLVAVRHVGARGAEQGEPAAAAADGDAGKPGAPPAAQPGGGAPEGGPAVAGGSATAGERAAGTGQPTPEG
jgi:hypothetical protein